MLGRKSMGAYAPEKISFKACRHVHRCAESKHREVPTLDAASGSDMKAEAKSFDTPT